MRIIAVKLEGLSRVDTTVTELEGVRRSLLPADKNDVYLWPEQLEEEAATPHLPSP